MPGCPIHFSADDGITRLALFQEGDGSRTVVDLDLCFSYGFFDPYGHELELSTYDRDTVKNYLEKEGISAIRHW